MKAESILLIIQAFNKIWHQGIFYKIKRKLLYIYYQELTPDLLYRYCQVKNHVEMKELRHFLLVLEIVSFCLVFTVNPIEARVRAHKIYTRAKQDIYRKLRGITGERKVLMNSQLLMMNENFENNNYRAAHRKVRQLKIGYKLRTT